MAAVVFVEGGWYEASEFAKLVNQALDHIEVVEVEDQFHKGRFRKATDTERAKFLVDVAHTIQQHKIG